MKKETAEAKRKTDPKKKRISPGVWGLIAAVLVLAVVAGVLMTQMIRARQESKFILPPMVYVEDRRWLYERDITEVATETMQAEFTYVGTITSVIEADQYVWENFQANSAVEGAEVYRFGMYVVLRYGESFTLYRPMDPVDTFVSETTGAK